MVTIQKKKRIQSLTTITEGKMSKNDLDKNDENYPDYQRAFAAIVYNTHLKFLTQLSDLYQNYSWAEVGMRQLWYAANILGALYAIALGHPTLRHNIPFERFPKQDLISPMECLEFMLLDPLAPNKFQYEAGLSVSNTSIPSLIQDVKKLKEIYVKPGKTKGFKPVNVKNISCYSSLFPESKDRGRIRGVFYGIPKPLFHMNVSETEVRDGFLGKKVRFKALDNFFQPVVLIDLIEEYIGKWNIPPITIEPATNFRPRIL